MEIPRIKRFGKTEDLFLEATKEKGGPQLCNKATGGYGKDWLRIKKRIEIGICRYKRYKFYAIIFVNNNHYTGIIKRRGSGLTPSA